MQTSTICSFLCAFKSFSLKIYLYFLLLIKYQLKSLWNCAIYIVKKIFNCTISIHKVFVFMKIFFTGTYWRQVEGLIKLVTEYTRNRARSLTAFCSKTTPYFYQQDFLSINSFAPRRLFYHISVCISVDYNHLRTFLV